MLFQSRTQEGFSAHATRYLRDPIPFPFECLPACLSSFMETAILVGDSSPSCTVSASAFQVSFDMKTSFVAVVSFAIHVSHKMVSAQSVKRLIEEQKSKTVKIEGGFGESAQVWCLGDRDPAST